MTINTVELTLRVEDINNEKNPIVAVFQQTANVANDPERMVELAANIWGEHQITVYEGSECTPFTRVTGYMNGKPQMEHEYVTIDHIGHVPTIEYGIHDTLH